MTLHNSLFHCSQPIDALFNMNDIIYQGLLLVEVQKPQEFGRFVSLVVVHHSNCVGGFPQRSPSSPDTWRISLTSAASFILIYF